MQLRGVRPFKSDKYDLTQHPNYKLTAGADKKNTFSIEAFLDHRLKLRPGDKYDITKHPNFKYTADADDKNAFDIEAFLSARLKLKPNEVCDVYEVDTKGA